MKRLTRTWLVAGATLLAAATAQAQLQTTSIAQGTTPEDMVCTLLGGGITVFNVTYTGANNASGLYSGGAGIIGFTNGVLLTSGDTANVIGPNNSPATSTDNMLGGDPDLNSLIPGFQTFDASVLEFDFVANGSQARFNYVFSSEEYNEFVDTAFNDVFGFFVNGVNAALIPGATTPVAINNVNNGNAASGSAAGGPCNNCAFYIDNANLAAPPLNTQMDGLTTVLPMTVPVNPGQTNHMKIAIADAGDHVLDSAVFIQASSFSSVINTSTTPQCVTRNTRYWFTHPTGSIPNCASLIKGLGVSQCGSLVFGVDLGFITLPVGFRDDNNVKDAGDAVIEALGLYWRSSKKTGELTGLQNSNIRGSSLCRERKGLAVELLAAIANNVVMGTNPTNCTYVSNGVTTNFPPDLIQQGRLAGASEDVNQITQTKLLLRKFNNSGVTNNFPFGLVECSAIKGGTLRNLSRDPTTKFTCPGINDSCQSAEAVVFPEFQTNLFSTASFSRSVNLSSYPAGLAFWKITAPTSVASRPFTVDTAGSNFDTVISVFSGACGSLTLVTTADNTDTSQQAKLSFRTDGGTALIVIAGKGGSVGKLKLKITSP